MKPYLQFASEVMLAPTQMKISNDREEYIHWCQALIIRRLLKLGGFRNRFIHYH